MIPPAWAHLPFFTEAWPAIARAVEADARTILPQPRLRFRALDLVPPNSVRAVILGQDPYPTPGHAVGLAFSVAASTTPLPRSLLNIFKELQTDLDLPLPRTSGDLTGWARQGVLLLNTCLTVPAGLAGAHARFGWHRLAEEVIAEVSRRPTAFLLWGAHARALAPHIRPGDHLILASVHPSPLSARQGFFGSRPFSRTNAWLTARGEAPVDWLA
jgi:uracil-DNA glycosylase